VNRNEKVAVYMDVVVDSGVPTNFFRGEVKQIQLRTEDRDLGAVAP